MEDTKLVLYNTILKKYWGYESLKKEQFNIISNVLDGKDVCAILATGFGKSICYQLPTLITKKCVIVISPLIALMLEQSEEMKKRNIPVCVFNSTTNFRDKENEKINLIKGNYKLIYMTPEYLLNSEDFLTKLAKNDNLAMVCIDEAHAVSTWGLDFRSSYTKLNVIREWVSEIPILTLTATASTKVKEDILKILNLQNPYEVIGNFDRPNLSIQVFPRQDDIISNIGMLLNKYKNEYIIIYCKTRDETDNLAETINNYGIKCQSYHAGINDKVRSEIQQEFIDGKYKCIIATIAFGMGINIPNVRLVIHYNCPKNMESYYQEIGRAGRDGKPSECFLFYSKKDFILNRLFLKTITNDEHRNYQENQIRLIEKYVYATECRRKLLLINFGQQITSCVNCDNCLKKLNNNTKVNLTDYTKETYIFLNLIYKLNDKFGSGMLINILLGKQSKIKLYMCNYEEFGLGLTFGSEVWWKEFVRTLINNDYLIETQIKGRFGSTLSLTNKGKTLRKKLLEKYPDFEDIIDDDNDDKILFTTIINNTKTKSTTKSTTKSKTKPKILEIKKDLPKIFIKTQDIQDSDISNSDLEDQ
jgi:RecQ family ATP-dependent DNA helicase